MPTRHCGGARRHQMENDARGGDLLPAEERWIVRPQAWMGVMRVNDKKPLATNGSQPAQPKTQLCATRLSPNQPRAPHLHRTAVPQPALRPASLAHRICTTRPSPSQPRAPSLNNAGRPGGA